MEIFAVKDLNFRYPDSEKNALSDITLSVREGEFVTVCGLSGCGKSTLLRHLKTCLTPEGIRSGEILFEGIPLESADHRTQSSKIGFVMQSPDNQSVTDKVWHELAFGLESLGHPQNVIRQRTAETAAFFGIEKWFESPVDELSGGQRQILNLASVMVTQPSVLILDEPTSCLDPIATHDFLSLLKRINRELSTTVIISEHTLDDVLSLSDRVIVMSDGKIISDSAPEKTGGILYRSKDPVFMSLPAFTRVYEYASDDEKNAGSPVSLPDAREWIRSQNQKQPLSEPPEETDSPKGSKLIDLKNLWFRYEKNSPDILKGTELTINKGEILSVLGGNGAGKTTLLSVLTGLARPYRGKIYINGKPAVIKDPRKFGLALLPQDPQTLFVRETVRSELEEMLSDSGYSDCEKQARISYVSNLCGLNGLLERHPYDLSGGEQQKAALAKILLTEPEILLLDEPTKGLDCAFRHRLALILRKLTENGTTVILVSHDLEFCSVYSDRCAMLFGGRIVSRETPKRFFSENGIYTTSISRMTKGIVRNTVTVKDALFALGKDNIEQEFLSGISGSGNDRTVPPPKNKDEPKQRRSKKTLRKVPSYFSLSVFLFSLLATAGIIRVPYKNYFFSVMIVSAVIFMLSLRKTVRPIKIVPPSRSVRRIAVSVITVLIAVPITILIGVYCFKDSKYLFISLTVLFESILPFYIIFEKRPIQARELVLIAVLCSICVTGRAAFYMLPAFKPVTALVIICAAALGSESGFMIGSVSMLASNVFFGQGIWTPWQMFTMGLIGFAAGILFSGRFLPVNRVSLSVFGFIAVFVIYGGIMNPATLILSRSPINRESLLSVYAFGLPMDTIHAVSTAVFLFIGAEPIIQKLERIKKKYGMIR